MPTSAQRCYHMAKLGTSADAIVKRLSAEFDESFWCQGNRIMEEYPDIRGVLVRRCLIQL